MGGREITLLGIIVVAIIILLLATQPVIQKTEEYCINADSGKQMTLAEAREIAMISECGEQGTLKKTQICNEFTGTWWLDLDIDKPGCNPACVVNVETGEAEINWRCTGLLT